MWFWNSRNFELFNGDSCGLCQVKKRPSAVVMKDTVVCYSNNHVTALFMKYTVEPVLHVTHTPKVWVTVLEVMGFEW